MSDDVKDHIWSVTEPASLKKNPCLLYSKNYKEWHPTIGKIQNLGG